VLARAAADPTTLVWGLDASRDAMLKAAIRVGRPSRRGTLANARFVVAAAEALPRELDGIVDELTVHFPWGSLLRGLLGPEGCVLAGLARLLRPGRCATVLLSLAPRDRQPELPPLDRALAARLAGPYSAHGLRLVDWRPTTPAEVAAAHSTWAKRLGAGRARPVWRLQILRTARPHRDDSSSPAVPPPSTRLHGELRAALALSDGVVAQPVEQAREGRHVIVTEPRAQAPVEGDGRRAQAVEEGLAGLGELDEVDATVRRVGAARDQAGGLHGVEVVGEGRALDADRLGEPALVGRPLRLERDEDQPDRYRPAGRGQRIVEGAADGPGGAREMEADRRADGWRHTSSIAQPVVV
jgi:16S rRNA (adenine(1408)-N(1))-methyltransferase